MSSRNVGVHSFKWLILIEVDIFAYLVFKDLKAVITVVYHCVLRCIQACDVKLKNEASNPTECSCNNINSRSILMPPCVYKSLHANFQIKPSPKMVNSKP